MIVSKARFTIEVGPGDPKLFREDLRGLSGLNPVAGQVDLYRTMPYDEELAEKVRRALDRGGAGFDEKRMMGGICFMVDGKMCVGVDKSRIMVRLDPGEYEDALERPGCEPMDFTGRPMRGFVFVYEEGYRRQRDLDYWIKRALAYNPTAKASRKRNKRKR